MPDSNQSKEKSFVRKVWITGFILALIATILLLIEATFNIFILVLAGVLIASYFRGISGFIAKKTGWGSRLSLTASIFGSVILMSGIIF